METRQIMVLAMVAVASACGSTVTTQDDLKPWPAPAEGESRYVINLPAMPDESAHGIELIIGQEMEIDCNQHWFGGKFERQVVSGWGYPLYRLTSVAGPASTMMACPEEEKRTAFVQVRLEDPFVRYNSKLPLVVYVPEGFSVQFRPWSADGEVRSATNE